MVESAFGRKSPRKRLLGDAPRATSPGPMTQTHPNVRHVSAFGAFAMSRLVARVVARTRRGGGSWAQMRMTFLLRQWALRRLKGRPVDTETLGVKMRLHPHDDVAEKRLLFTPQYFDPAERRFLEPHLAKGGVFIDIGANVGGYALWAAARLAPGGRVIAVEPEPELFERLSFNIGVNPTGIVKAVNAAVADFNGRLTLFVDRRNRGGTSLRIAKDAPGGGEAVEATAVTLAGLVATERLERIDVLKVDVEGAEDLVLSPFLHRADRSLLPSVIVLNHLRGQWAEDLDALLARTGYVEAGRTAANVLYELENR